MFFTSTKRLEEGGLQEPTYPKRAAQEIVVSVLRGNKDDGAFRVTKLMGIAAPLFIHHSELCTS